MIWRTGDGDRDVALGQRHVEQECDGPVGVDDLVLLLEQVERQQPPAHHRDQGAEDEPDRVIAATDDEAL